MRFKGIGKLLNPLFALAVLWILAGICIAGVIEKSAVCLGAALVIAALVCRYLFCRCPHCGRIWRRVSGKHCPRFGTPLSDRKQ